MKVEIRQPEYDKWRSKLDAGAQAVVTRRIDLLAEHGISLGMPNVRRLAAGLFELRAGKYRLYFTVLGDTARFLTFGEKDTQTRDIERARKRMT